MNQLKPIYNSPFKDSHPIHICLPIIASNVQYVLQESRVKVRHCYFVISRHDDNHKTDFVNLKKLHFYILNRILRQLLMN